MANNSILQDYNGKVVKKEWSEAQQKALYDSLYPLIPSEIISLIGDFVECKHLVWVPTEYLYDEKGYFKICDSEFKYKYYQIADIEFDEPHSGKIYFVTRNFFMFH